MQGYFQNPAENPINSSTEDKTNNIQKSKEIAIKQLYILLRHNEECCLITYHVNTVIILSSIVMELYPVS